MFLPEISEFVLPNIPEAYRLPVSVFLVLALYLAPRIVAHREDRGHWKSLSKGLEAKKTLFEVEQRRPESIDDPEFKPLLASINAFLEQSRPHMMRPAMSFLRRFWYGTLGSLVFFLLITLILIFSDEMDLGWIFWLVTTVTISVFAGLASTLYLGNEPLKQMAFGAAGILVFSVALGLLSEAYEDEVTTIGPQASGFIVDGTGTPIPNASVFFLASETDEQHFGESDDTGSFVLADVSEGEYSAIVFVPGFELETAEVRVSSDVLKPLVLKLDVGRTIPLSALETLEETERE